MNEMRRVQVTIKFDSRMTFLQISDMLNRLGFSNLEITEFYDRLVK